MLPEIRTAVAIIGAGTAGLYALREVRRAGRSFVLIDHGPLGTTCARVGCMPSKVALHAAALWQARPEMNHFGMSGGETPQLDLARTWAALRAQRDHFSNKAAQKARTAAGEQLIEGRARFIEPTLLEVSTSQGVQRVRADAVVIATGSRPQMPAWLSPVRDRLVTTDQLFELEQLPQRIGVLGLGAIGLEMGLALARLGVQVTAVGGSNLAGIDDPQVAARAEEHFAKEMTLWLGPPATVERTEQGVMLRSGERAAEVDLLLVAIGRRPNTDGLNLADAGIAVDEHGVPLFDPATLQLGDWPVFIAGDANGQLALLHEAADDGSIAGYNAARQLRTRFRRRVPLGIVFANPDVVSVGARLSQLDPHQLLIGSASGESNGRLRILGGENSLLNIYADRDTGQLRGAALLCNSGEHLAHLLAWAIQRGETAQSLLQLPFYHPVVEELLATALQEIAMHFPDDNDLPMGLVTED
ncbi:dihydrolipoyl dehydrogenase [Halopseudomonas pelagia]|uniref:dihydrolipoyl dehydrogenase n=1 Tax=Halopseudomonas pelagia TaxID=553151 RepID=UPI0030D9ECC1|tara:strand:- start:9484 stop:10899 length:1416 start_codon:yes stop_codon:yes gene_type:complete